MADKVQYRHFNKPFRARRRRGGVEYFMGYFPTKDEAEQHEREFDKWWPPQRGGANRGKQWDRRVGRFV